MTLLSFGCMELLSAYIATAVGTQSHMAFPDQHRNLLASVFSAANGVSMSISDLCVGQLWSALGLSQSLVIVGGCGFILALATVVAMVAMRVSKQST